MFQKNNSGPLRTPKDNVDAFVPPGWSNLNEDVFYRKVELYQNCWKLDFSRVKFYGCPCGGPIAVTRDGGKAVAVIEQELVPTIDIYTSSGIALASLKLKFYRNIVTMGWTNTEKLCIILEYDSIFFLPQPSTTNLLSDATVMLYTILGELSMKFNMEDECKSAGILEAKIWETGLAVITKNLQIYAITDIETPYTIKLKNPGLTALPKSWLVMKPEQSKDGQLTIYLSVLSGTVILVTQDTAQDMLINKGPFSKMALSANGKILGAYTKNGDVWFVQSDFSKPIMTFETKTLTPPKQMEWVGGDAILCYWEYQEDRVLFMIGPKSKWLKYPYDDSVFLVPEVDGLRIISKVGCEFLQRVPQVTTSIFRMLDSCPATLLISAFECYKKDDAKSYYHIRALKEQNILEAAVDSCIEAAGHEFDVDNQKKLLGAASFGKGNIRNYNPTKFVSLGKTLRITNQMREFNMGMPLTVAQYYELTPDRIIERLINRHKHLLATEISQFLDLKTERVLLHWAIAKIHSNMPGQVIVQSIIEKLATTSSNLSFAAVANEAYRAGREDAAILLCDHEPRAENQVPLLIRMKKMERALPYAVQSGDTDLIELVLENLPFAIPDLHSLIAPYPDAYNTFIVVNNQTNIEKLKEMYVYEDKFDQLAKMDACKALTSKNAGDEQRLYKSAIDNYKKVDVFNAKATEEQLGLAITQRNLESCIFGEKFVGLSMVETMFKLIKMGEEMRAEKMVAQFGISFKKFALIKVRALAESSRWDSLRTYFSTKHGLAPKYFASVAIEKKNESEALFYINNIQSLDERVLLLLELGAWSDALKVVVQIRKPRDLLIKMRSICPIPEYQRTINDLIEKS